MAEVISRRNMIYVGLVLIALSSLSCNFTGKALQQQPTNISSSVPTEEVTVLPTKSPATETPTEALKELPTEAAATTIMEPTSTQKTVLKSPTRTVPPPTATSIPVIRQATQIMQPTAVTLAEGDMTVTAATGNLFIRRGPGTTYNIVSGLSKGTTTKAVGRNEKNDWLALEIPRANGTIGWISMGTGYTELSGKITSLPLYPYDEPKPAYIQNCTLHDLTTRPGQWNLPAKTTQKVNPGEYTILDMYTGQNKVQDITVKEGNTVSVKVDGDGTSTSCP